MAEVDETHPFAIKEWRSEGSPAYWSEVTRSRSQKEAERVATSLSFLYRRAFLVIDEDKADGSLARVGWYPSREAVEAATPNALISRDLTHPYAIREWQEDQPGNSVIARCEDLLSARRVVRALQWSHRERSYAIEEMDATGHARSVISYSSQERIEETMRDAGLLPPTMPCHLARPYAILVWQCYQPGEPAQDKPGQWIEYARCRQFHHAAWLARGLQAESFLVVIEQEDGIGQMKRLAWYPSKEVIEQAERAAAKAREGEEQP